MKSTAIILSAGKGKRMNSKISKQYLEVYNKPILAYTVEAFEQSNVDEILLVVGKDDIKYVRDEIIGKNHFEKVNNIVVGGKERYNSVMNGINAITQTDYVLIHDGARPLIRAIDINNLIDHMKINKACVAAMPVKDTIKIADDSGIVLKTPNRKNVWQVQTPQAFHFDIIKEAYNRFSENPDYSITDDAMIMERYGNEPVKLVQTSYTNIKITTPEDIIIMQNYLENVIK